VSVSTIAIILDVFLAVGLALVVISWYSIDNCARMAERFCRRERYLRHMAEARREFEAAERGVTA
jgi:hypothetical protein